MTTLTQQTQLPRPGVRFGTLILVSIALHWLLLSAWNEVIATPPTATTLTVQLLPATPPPKHTPAPIAAPAALSKTVPVTRQAVQATEKTVPASAKTKTVPTTTPSVALTATTTAIPESAITKPAAEAADETRIPRTESKATRTLAQLHGMVRTTLTQDINRHFKYPRMARQRNWEGTVLLDLQIEIDGRISHITLAQSSGYALLDNNAIATLNRIGNISGSAQWLEGGNIELQIPVIYRLSDS
ncbi:MAG: TonB family protein [Pseudomonadota bacterium]|nr:TonB family protein [Pseudomonadota bacterium]